MRKLEGSWRKGYYGGNVDIVNNRYCDRKENNVIREEEVKDWEGSGVGVVSVFLYFFGLFWKLFSIVFINVDGFIYFFVLVCF